MRIYGLVCNGYFGIKIKSVYICGTVVTILEFGYNFQQNHLVNSL